MEKGTIVYHCSPLANLQFVMPKVGVHGMPYVFGSTNEAVALLFNEHWGEFNFALQGLGTEKYPLTFIEREEGMLERFFKGKKCYLYQVDEESFKEYDSQWQLEVLSPVPVRTKNVTIIEDLYEALKQLEKQGDIRLVKYKNRKKYIPEDNSDLIPKYAGHALYLLKSTLHPIMENCPELKEQIKNSVIENLTDYFS